MSKVNEQSIRKFMAEVDERELAIRLIEAYAGIRRKPGWTRDEAWARMPTEAQVPAIRQARAALAYMAECFAKASPVS